MGLDVNTPKGQATLVQEQEAAALLARMGLTYCETNKAGSAAVDAILMKGKRIMYVAEAKCRSMDRGTLMGTWGGEWLVTYDKIAKLAQCAALLRVPALGLLYMTKEPVLAVVRIANEDGEFERHMRIERTRTQATVNGSSANRVNAYIDMRGAKLLHP